MFSLSYAYSPRRYLLSERFVTVHRLIGKVSIPLDEIREIRKAGEDDFRGCLRLWGSGGLFGYYGLFRTSKLGKSTWYLTSRDNEVLVVTDAKRLLLSPDDADGVAD